VLDDDGFKGDARLSIASKSLKARAFPNGAKIKAIAVNCNKGNKRSNVVGVNGIAFLWRWQLPSTNHLLCRG
jgi:hypothetical protein